MVEIENVHCRYCTKYGHRKAACPLLPTETMSPSQTACHVINMMMYSGIVDNYAQTSSCLRWKEAKCKQLLSVVKPLFPDHQVQLHLFGSTTNGFAFNISDMDVCLSFGGERHNLPASVDAIRVVAKHLRKSKDASFVDRGSVMPLYRPKVPLVKFVLKENSVPVDFSIHNALVLRNTQLLQTYCRMDDRVRVLGITVKFWAKSQNIGDAADGGLSSYAYLVCLIYFLQRTKPAVLPVLQELFDGESKPEDGHLVEGNNTYFDENEKNKLRTWTNNTTSAAELWIDFLHFFGRVFDHKSTVVQIRTPIDRVLTKSETGDNFTNKPFSVQDPFKEQHNIAGSLRDFAHLLRCFRQSASTFDNEGLMKAAFRNSADLAEMTERCFVDLCTPPPVPKGGKKKGEKKEKQKENARPTAAPPKDNAVTPSGKARRQQRQRGMKGRGAGEGEREK